MLNTLEINAQRAKAACSFWDYKPGSATLEYQEYCNHAEEIANQAKEKLLKNGAPAERSAKVDYLLNLYKSKKLTWLNDLYANRARVPSVMIAGPSKFPVRAKEKQIAREDTLMSQNPDYILDEIRGIGRNSKTIYSDEKDAVKRIKAKIKSLEGVSDPYGNKAAEIRRLKERLFILAPEEFKEQQENITVNGAKTYNEILALWDTGKIHKSVYDPDSNKWYYDLLLEFSNGKRRYRGYISIEVDEGAKNQICFNLNTRQNELVLLTDERKYNLIICQISGSGNKNIMYQYLKSLSPAHQTKAIAAENQDTNESDKVVTIQGESVKVIANKDEMRLQLFFNGKPCEEIRNLLKLNGFRWAPSAMAWQRLLNDNAMCALRRICDKKRDE